MSVKNVALTTAGAIGVATLAATLGSTIHPQTAEAALRASAPVTAELKPVETDMHEYMEYVHQPAYKRLKAVMAEPEKDGKAWLGVKSDSLILAESGNLIQLRGPEGESRDDWNAHAVQVRETGRKLYRAAHEKDDEAAQQHYRTLLQNCNACHTQFAGGEHMLKP